MSSVPPKRNLDHYRQQALIWLTRKVCQYHVPVILISVALAVASVLYTHHSLTFKTNRNDLVRADSATQRIFNRYTKEFRQDEDLIIVVESPDPERNRECL